MILNAYAVLDAALSLLRLLVGLLVVGLAITSLRGVRISAPSEGRMSLEDRGSLLFLLAFLLLGSSLASWPLLYLLLQSYVPEWPGAMCIYGVTQVGYGSLGASRFLPGLLKALQVMKPALVFCGGAWLVLHLANHRTSTAPLTRRTLLVLVVLGLLAAADAAVELSYLAIPKKEEFLPAGCCTAAFDERSHASRFLPEALTTESARRWLSGAYYGANLAMVLGLLSRVRRLRCPGTKPRLAALLAGALITLLVSAVFLVEVAAPLLLRLPYHHCPYDLIPRVPEAVLGVALFLGGTFSVGWACVAGWFADCPETRPFLGEDLRKILTMGLWLYLGSLVMMSVELALA
jgi:hypothetical protein